jgi:hypothetical protein
MNYEDKNLLWKTRTNFREFQENFRKMNSFFKSQMLSLDTGQFFILFLFHWYIAHYFPGLFEEEELDSNNVKVPIKKVIIWTYGTYKMLLCHAEM